GLAPRLTLSARLEGGILEDRDDLADGGLELIGGLAGGRRPEGPEPENSCAGNEQGMPSGHRNLLFLDAGFRRLRLPRPRGDLEPPDTQPMCHAGRRP